MTHSQKVALMREIRDSTPKERDQWRELYPIMVQTVEFLLDY